LNPGQSLESDRYRSWSHCASRRPNERSPRQAHDWRLGRILAAACRWVSSYLRAAHDRRRKDD